jgi:hypothetical protein
MKLEKAQGGNKLCSIYVVIDDFPDDPSFSRQSNSRCALHARGGHNSVSATVSTQIFRAIRAIIHASAASLDAHRLRSSKEFVNCLDDMGGITGKKELLEIYKVAVKTEFSSHANI